MLSPTSKDGNQSDDKFPFHVVVVPSGGEAYVASHRTMDDMLASVSALHDVNVYMFVGSKLQMTKVAKQRYVLDPNGKPVPLYPDDPGQVEIDPASYIP